MIWCAVSSIFLSSKMNAAIYLSDNFILVSTDSLGGDARFLFQQNLAPSLSAKTTTKAFAVCSIFITVINFPANSPDLNPTKNLWGIAKRKLRNNHPKNPDRLKAAIKETWASKIPQQCHKLMPHSNDAVILL